MMNKSEKRYIPVAAPALVGNEEIYVLDCLNSNWISSNGSYIDRFEKSFASFCNVKHALTCSNGTVALHLALLGLGVQAGDEVILPTLTYVATANAVFYCGAMPVFVDSELATWNIDPSLIEAKITKKTKGIIVVHLYGHPVDMGPVQEIAKKYDLFLLEDAAESPGAEYKGQKVGSIGDVATFSFYGNKIITSGEGGMVVTNDEEMANRMRQIKGQGMDPNRRYWFTMVGYNYRLTNIAAAIGLAQLEKIDWHLSRRQEIAKQYKFLLQDVVGITLQQEKKWARNVFWMNSIVLDDQWPLSRDETMQRLAEAGIETRPFFYPMHVLPIYQLCTKGQSYPVAEHLANQGINLPSSASITSEDVIYICECISRISRV